MVNRIAISKGKMRELDGSLMLFFTGITRRADDLERRKLRNIVPLRGRLKRMHGLVEKAHGILTSNRSLAAFGELLDVTWREKRALDSMVSNPLIDRMYARALAAGALGGKLLGAGGGGFMLFFVPQEKQARVRKALGKHIEVPFSINAPGSRVIHS